MKDKLGNVIKVGDKVARAILWGNYPQLAIQTVTSITDAGLYLDNSAQHIRYLDRLVVLYDKVV